MAFARVLRSEADEAEHLIPLSSPVGIRQVGEQAQRLDQRLFNAEPGIQRLRWVLEHHLDAPAVPRHAEFPVDRFTVEQDRAGRSLLEADDHPAEGGLAAT